MKNIMTLFTFLMFITIVNAQNEYTISGTITDKNSGEFLIGANIYLTQLEKGTTTNNYGFYSLTVQGMDSLGIVYSYLGYDGQIKKLFLTQNIELNIEMVPRTNQLNEIIVVAKDDNQNVTNVQMGVINIPTTKIKELPAILGEVDVLKVVQLLPGVQSGNEGTTGFHVRGGATDQNLIQLDEAIIYNPNHLVGLFSTFNASAINNVNLIKGGFPSQYGGRLSSVLDISMKEGNKKQFKTEGGIGLVTTQISVEGPIIKDKASFIMSGRRAYFDYLIKPVLPKSVSTNYLFYDLNAKVNYQIGKKDRLYLSTFKSKDNASYSQDGIAYHLQLGNQTATLRWNHLLSPKLFVNTSFIYNNYRQDISALQDNALSEVVSGINDLNGKIEIQYFPNPENSIKFGFHYLNHTFKSSGDSKAFVGSIPPSGINIKSIPEKKFNEYAYYINDEIKLHPKFSMNLGVRFPGFFAKEANYFKIEPRAIFQFQLNKSSSLKASYTLMNQFLHLIPSSTAAIPSDIWIPSTKNTKPQFSNQYTIGLFKNFNQNSIETNIEFYYKTMKNQVLFREGNQLIKSLDVDKLLVYGEGWSYGGELYLKKAKGRFTGWVSYTLAWTYQKFNELNYGKKFPFRYDTRHNLSLVGTYELNKKWTVSSTFVYSSGSAFTVPVGRTAITNGGSLFEGNYYIYEGRNNARLNPFHRLNVSFSYKKKRKFFNMQYDSEWVFGAYNIYSRLNPYFIYFDIDPVNEKPRAVQVSLLPFVPSVSYNFKF